MLMIGWSGVCERCFDVELSVSCELMLVMVMVMMMAGVDVGA